MPVERSPPPDNCRLLRSTSRNLTLDTTSTTIYSSTTAARSAPIPSATNPLAIAFTSASTNTSALTNTSASTNTVASKNTSSSTYTTSSTNTSTTTNTSSAASASTSQQQQNPSNNKSKRRRSNSSGNHNNKPTDFFNSGHQFELILMELSDRIDNLTSTLNNNTDQIKTLMATNGEIQAELESIKALSTTIFFEITTLKSAVNDSVVSSKSTQMSETCPSTVEPVKKSNKTFANVLKEKPSEMTVIIKPAETQDNKSTFEAIKKNITPTGLDLHRVRNLSKGGIAVECKTSSSALALKESASSKLGDGYKVTIPNKVLPQIRVFGLSERLTLEQITKHLLDQNNDIFDTNSTVTVHVTFTSSNRHGFKMSTDPTTFAKIITAGKLRVGWDICRAQEAVSFKRCYNCSEYYHTAKDCNSTTVCAKCSGPHNTRECTSSFEQCRNCILYNEKLRLNLDVQHSALALNCPVYLRLVERQRGRTDYGPSKD